MFAMKNFWVLLAISLTVFLVIFVIISFFIWKEKEFIKERERKKNTIRYFRWERKSDSLVLVSELNEFLLLVPRGSEYSFTSGPTEDLSLTAVEFILENCSFNPTFYISRLDVYTLDVIAQKVGIKCLDYDYLD